MSISAIIVIPLAGPRLPSYLFEPVAGVPLLIRQILSLQRAGISQVTILVAAEQHAELAQELNRQRPTLGQVTITSHWPDLGDLAGPSQPAEYVLLLSVNTLPSRQVYAALLNKLPPPGTLRLAGGPDVDLFSAGWDENHHAVRGQMPSGVPPQHDPVGADNTVAHATYRLKGSIALFSQTAWQAWLSHYRSARGEPGGVGHSVWASFRHFLARQTALGHVVTVTLGPAEFIRVSAAADLKAATDRLITLENGSPLSEGFLEIAWSRRLARYLLPRILALPISPNQITVFSFLLGLVAVGGFAHGSYAATVTAGLLLPLILLLDCLDGAVARLKFQESPLGALLDIHGDSILNLLLFLGIVIGCYRNSGQPFFGLLGILIIIGYVACWQLARSLPSCQSVGSQPRAGSPPLGDKLLAEAVSRDFFYIILIAALLRRLDWLVIALAVGTNIFAWLLYRQQTHGHD
ncbi:MAG: CDP-alcohol phosphatidyltransferase family protein [Desulfobacca sp.]|uniref:CDP-alcohol phosphatidyltransferase family protein n=1 Tax=Desulfobacca sp. TaxID=2067990 RepID=UPI00404A4038